MSERRGVRQTPSLSKGRYSNYFEVGHNALEFLIDFGQFYENDNRKNLHTRIVTSPVYARRLAETLIEALRAYEQAFGAIVDESGMGRPHKPARPQ